MTSNLAHLPTPGAPEMAGARISFPHGSQLTRCGRDFGAPSDSPPRAPLSVWIPGQFSVAMPVGKPTLRNRGHFVSDDLIPGGGRGRRRYKNTESTKPFLQATGKIFTSSGLRNKATRPTPTWFAISTLCGCHHPMPPHPPPPPPPHLPINPPSAGPRSKLSS